LPIAESCFILRAPVRVTLAKEGKLKMSAKIFAGVCAVLLAVLLLASVPLATAASEAKRAPEANRPSDVERDFYQCLGHAPILPPLDEVKTCMIQRGNSEEETTGVIRFLPDQGLFAPYTGYENRGS
jgi:hypothetical protein